MRSMDGGGVEKKPCSPRPLCNQPTNPEESRSCFCCFYALDVVFECHAYFVLVADLSQVPSYTVKTYIQHAVQNL